MTTTKTMRSAGLGLALAGCLLAFLFINPARATPGGLDAGFGTGGKVTTMLGPNNDYGNDLIRQPDGKLVVAGSSTQSITLGDFALARYNPNGSLDPSFNGTGKVTTAIGPSWDSVWALVRQPDGKLVAAGETNNGSNFDFALARYNPNGSLDTSFNGTGKVTTAIGSGDEHANALVLQPDGKLVVAGRSYNGSDDDFVLARYNPNGSLDTSFNGTGKVTTPIGAADDAANAVAVQPDGKLVAAGDTRINGQLVVALARYNPNGSLDASFNGTGKVTTTIGNTAAAHALILQPNGKAVIAGVGTNATFDFALARYNPNGSLDTTFGSGGKVATPIGSGNDVAEGLVLQPDGKLAVAGYSYVGSRRVFALARFNPNGSLDTSLTGTGKAMTTIGSDDQATGLMLQQDGKLVAAGYGSNGSQQVFELVRYSGSALTVSRTGSGTGSVTSSPGGISCGSTCSAPFAAVPVTLTATAAPGSSFAGWSGPCSGTGICTVAMGSDRAVTARFESDKTLTLAKAGNGAGAVTSNPAGISCGVSCAHTFRYGTALTLTAAATPRSAFIGWSGACSGTAGTCTVTMSAARSVTATFAARCIVPKAKGKTLRAAKRAVVKAHCAVGKVKKAFSAKVKKGRVVAQSAKPGKKLAPGAKIRLTVSKGKRP